ncbi:MAG TPA: 4Fe-4S dicluster domain-containing protein [candidate division Zixibacteria bacterium]|nr:4Fe-4S dicluster domain-containing protein [candidate division Zixibacteria bacterium]
MKVDPKLLSEVRKYGEFDVTGCFNCGSCTVKCNLSKDSPTFPRKSMRHVIMGLKEHLNSSLEPWLCYYCGDCSRTCPRQAEPGEAMMTLRRYLTSMYDWTGLASRFYRSVVWEIGAILLVGAFVLALGMMFHGPIVTERVELNTFAPVEKVHLFDMGMFVVLSFFIISNAFHMFWVTMYKDKSVKIPISLYVTQLKELIVHAATQKRFKECTTSDRWIKHWLLVVGYATMFILVVVFLNWFQTDNIYPIYHPQRWLGYFATIVLVIFTVEIIYNRILKREQIHRFSHLSDWLFPILLLLTAVSGIAVHMFRYLSFPLPTYYTYAIHMAIAVPMLVVEVPFGKWSHLVYRPLALYFQSIKDKAMLLQVGESKHG